MYEKNSGDSAIELARRIVKRYYNYYDTDDAPFDKEYKPNELILAEKVIELYDEIYEMNEPDDDDDEIIDYRTDIF
jgi:hypothetical protein